MAEPGKDPRRPSVRERLAAVRQEAQRHRYVSAGGGGIVAENIAAKLVDQLAAILEEQLDQEEADQGPGPQHVVSIDYLDAAGGPGKLTPPP